MTLPPEYFEEMYDASTDPWGFASRWYETRKRALVMAMLPEQHYGSVFEPGCSTGLLTRELARRCDHLVAIDVSTAAVATARTSCSGYPHVTIERAGLPDFRPAGPVDLLVVSEVLYYLDRPTAKAVATKAFTSANTVVATHWRHPVDDYPLTGDDVHGILDDAARRGGHRLLGGYRDADFVAAVWSRDSRSVAQREGLT